ncbi:MAG: hypothetical protein C0622_14505 [Desulfuromonas sp.]|nr:MAG: hypothetical protein C0622_14505 [Desulfuromonas sp.]
MELKAKHYQNCLEEVLNLDEYGLPDQAIKKAEEIAEQALKVGDDGYAKFFQAEALCLQGKLKEGLKLEADAVSILNDVTFIQVNYGVLLSMTGHVKKALLHLDIALENDPNNLQALAQKGVCLAKLSRYDEGLVCFNRILEIDPKNAHAIRNKGVCLSNLYHEDEALEHFERALDMNPKDTHAKSEKRILKDELELRRTPLGWLAYKIRKSLLPKLRALKLRLFD